MCSKYIYETEDEARRELEHCRLKREVLGKRNRQETEFYYCGECDAYHLTSKRYDFKINWGTK